MDKLELLQRLDKAWVAFRTSYLGLSEPQLSAPGVVGNWSVRDIIAHVTTWEEEALKHLPLIYEGWQATTVFGDLWWDQRFQPLDDGAETGLAPLRGAPATGGNPPAPG